MKMAMQTTPTLSEAEMQRRAQIRKQRERECRAQARSRWRQMIINGVRRAFIFMLAAMILTLIITYRNQIHSLTSQKVNHAIIQIQTKEDTSDPLRKHALNYEKEVEEAAGK